ncbi:conjugal transfer protein TrbH [Ancylobacter oerskovii]|uniref:Conjugal transfer protein TrbH n=1 Tax=Ancylobacter oerskovii TaxID=459519 RepID=A0ABW4Z674_9HYPH|nr:conjugal transfer protein TrbH [Ancylobacter oerskovii]MBS7546454.1 conjugal transfer protein TrbH [Ancylobacter oerskovii]
MPVRHLRICLPAALLALALAGCQSLNSGGLALSTAPAEISGSAASAIAGDMVSRLSEQIGPGKVTVALKLDSSPFGQALEASLQAWGYAVVTDQATDDKTKLVALAYSVEPYEGQVLVRLSTSSFEIGRAYSVTVAGAVPASPLSVMQRG